MIENNRRIDGAGVIGVFSYGGMPPDLAQGEHPALRGEGAAAAEGRTAPDAHAGARERGAATARS